MTPKDDMQSGDTLLRDPARPSTWGFAKRTIGGALIPRVCPKCGALVQNLDADLKAHVKFHAALTMGRPDAAERLSARRRNR